MTAGLNVAKAVLVDQAYRKVGEVVVPKSPHPKLILYRNRVFSHYPRIEQTGYGSRFALMYREEAVFEVRHA